MDRLSGLPDELIMQILHNLPTKDAVATSILGKRWETLWRYLPNLKFKSTNPNWNQSAYFQYFLDENLPIHKVPLDSLVLDVEQYSAESIAQWIGFAIQKSVKELQLKCIYFPNRPRVLPMNLYTSESLVILKVNGSIMMEVPRKVHLPSLRFLHLKHVRFYYKQNPMGGLLSNCPVLEELRLTLPQLNYVEGPLTISGITLKKLSIFLPQDHCDISEFKLETPNLEFLKIVDHCETRHYYSGSPMPNLREADIDIDQDHWVVEGLLRLIKSVKRLKMYSEETYHIQGFNFDNLDHLSTPNGKMNHMNILFKLLKDSPNLKELDVFVHRYGFFKPRMNAPRAVPECLLSSLTTYTVEVKENDAGEMRLVRYILKNAAILQTATVKIRGDEFYEERKMELEGAPRASADCRIIFVALPF